MGTLEGDRKATTETWPDSADQPLGVCYFDTNMCYLEINDWLAADEAKDG